MSVVINGLYSVSDTYFKEFESRSFCDNKNENRPYFLPFKDENGILWLIPLSSQVENYRDKIKRDEQKYKECLFYHIGSVMGKDRAFLIGNMFPVTEEYIKKPYTFSGRHHIIANEQLI